MFLAGAVVLPNNPKIDGPMGSPLFPQKDELQRALRLKTIFMPPYGGIIKAAPYGFGFFT